MFFQISENEGLDTVSYCGFYSSRYDGETMTNVLTVIFISDETNPNMEVYRGFRIEFRERESKFLICYLHNFNQ